MADPILTVIDPNTFLRQDYTVEDTELISSQEIETPFNTAVDSVELYWYDSTQQLIAADTNYIGWKSYQDSSIPTSGELQALYVDPIIDGQAAGITNGDVYLVYNFVANKLLSSSNNQYYISSISGDRTEISLKSNTLDDQTILSEVENFSQELNGTNYFEEFYLNFGDNNRIIGLNIRGVETNNGAEVQIKLYEPLPNQFNVKTNTWIQVSISDSVGYQVTYDEDIILPDTTERLRGPNFNLQLGTKLGNTSEFQSYNSLTSTTLTGSLSQMKGLLQKYQVKLNIDYTDYSNFVHFSSATSRLQNFFYKASLIESYQNDINAITGSTAPTIQQSQSIAVLQGNINSIIANFDGYDNYLYYESGSKAWPKVNSNKPYVLASTGSTEVLDWYGTAGLDGTGELYTASLYDNSNQDNLLFSIPEFIREDSSNAAYEIFVEMIGQHFDNLYLYTEAITQKYNADNRLDYGVSKDLIADTLKSFGIKIYENNFSTDDLYTALIGLTPEGSTVPLPSISQIFPVTGSGLEYIDTIISASNDVIPLDDLNKSIYKRLYHNLPALVKKKGTLAGLQLLRNIYGIPDTILRINEFGGKDKNTNTWDYWQSEYDYALNTQGTTFITSSLSVNTAWSATDNVPGAVEFRFKTPGIPLTANYSQSLWSTDKNVALRLKYVGSGLTSGSYEGSVVNPYYQYGRLEFFPDSTDLNSSASLYLPFFDGGWWSVLVNKNADNSYTVYSGNSIYDGKDGNTLGFTAAGTVTKLGNWSGSIESYFGSSSLDATLFSGSLQEIRYYKNPISRSVFNDYIMNPNSIEGNEINSAPDQLIFRASLGGELYTGSTSIHPKVSGEWINTSSFSSDSSFYFSNTPVYNSNNQISFYDQPAAGIQNPVSNKIKLQDSTLYGTTLSNLASLQQNYPASQSFTRDINYLEVGYSPQNEINEDIMDSIGYFNLGDYIGDPRQISSSAFTYPALEQLKKDYFKKYNKSYNYQDYFRLIKFYDNSLFKLIKDFIPARTSAATGAIVKQHLLERNRQRPAQLTWTRPEYSGSVLSVARDYESGSIGVFEGGPAGAVNDWINVDQSYTASVLGPAGLVTYVESSEKEFYDGAYSGSRIDVVNNKLQDNPLLGGAYRIGIPDRQNLNVKSAAFLASASLFDGLAYYSTGSIKFNNLITPIDYYNVTTYKYTPDFNIQADISINVTGSIISGSQETGEFYVYFYANGAPVANTSYFTTTSNEQEAFTLNLTIPNYYLISGTTYEVKYKIENNFPLAVTTASIDVNTSWTVSVDNLYAQSTYYLDPTVYTQQNFPGNINEFPDYNSLLNNVYSNRVSSKYFDVDYNNNALNPTNFTPIVSQSALYAQIQDSNYDPKSAFFETRYGGTKYTGTLNTTQSLKSNSIPPSIPVDSFISYFAVSDRISPRSLNVVNIHITQLVGSAGEIIPINTKDSQIIGLLQQIFPSNTTGSLLDGSTSLNASGSIESLFISASGVYFNGTTLEQDVNSIVATNNGLTRNSQTLIIPQNYNPNLNPISIAKEAGLI